MDRALRGVRRPGKSAPKRDDHGFAVLEVLIAATFLCTVMVGIGSVLATQMVSVTSSTSWKVANGLLNQAMEEIRALPSTTLAAGLSDLTSCDSTAPGGSNPDANIHMSGSTWTLALNSETIPHGDLSCTSPNPTTTPPLIPHETTTTLNHLPFTVAVYPSIPSGMPSGIVRVTGIVTWKQVGLMGVHQISAQTLVYPTTCLAAGNNAYAGPCQALITAGAGANTGGSIQVTGTVAGLTFDQFFEVLPSATSSMQIQQTTTVSGCAVTSGGQTVIAGAEQAPTGEAKACSSADNDPGTNSSTWQTSSSGSQTSTTLSLPGSLSNVLQLSLGGGDSGTSTSSVAATGSPPTGAQACTDLAGTAQTVGQPCGSSSVTGAGAESLSLSLANSLLGSLGAVPLLSTAASSAPASSFVGRYTSSGTSSSYCKTPSATSGDGCVHAGATRSFGLLQLGGLPSGVLGSLLSGGLAPVGWALGGANCPAGNYLVALTSYSDSVTAESGIDSTSPTAASSGTPYLCYWNGSGYSSTSAILGSTSPSLPINSGSFTFSNLANTLSVAISSNISLGTATTTSSPSPWAANTSTGCWQSPCTARATVTSPVQGSYSYTVSAASILGGPLVQIANVNVQFNLGELTASTSYQAAPPQ
ncbi:MAG TPA: hypothetical protein VKR22_02010 [Acidimicrobiales bacterium]|nr:hypothetical protein [Acidimicrobiales bacterium]